MNSEQRRFEKAKFNLAASHLNPVTELMVACDALITKLTRERDQAVTTMGVLRPVWAQGFTSDSEAAQANGNALSEIWEILKVKNQTEAMSRLREMLS